MPRASLGIALFAACLVSVGCSERVDPPNRPTVDEDRAALLFGVGPHKHSDSIGVGCVGHGITRWRTGSAIRVVISIRDFERHERAALRDALAGIAIATDGQVQANLVETDAAPLAAADGEIAVRLVENALEAGCAYSQGCAIANFETPEMYLRSGVFIAVPGHSPQATIHDVVGHLALGLCHIDAKYARSDPSLMAFGDAFYDFELPMGITARDIRAVRSAYQSSLPPQSSVDDAVRTGLLPGGDMFVRRDVVDDADGTHVMFSHAR